MEQQLISIGRFGKTHGLKGQLHARIENYFLERLKKLDCVFIAEKGKMIPHFVEELKIDEGGYAFLKLEEINTREAAQKLVTKEFAVETKKLKKSKVAHDFSQLTGYEVVDEANGSIGEMKGVFLFPAHALGQCFMNEKEVLIPLHEETIVSIDKRKKILHVNLPDGLLDIYIK